jgi:enhancing lycopene biosynthesis protein 2
MFEVFSVRTQCALSQRKFEHSNEVISLTQVLCRKFNAAMVMHGNGVYDGTETTEAVSLLVSLSRAGAHVQCYAPNKDQAHVVNHLDGEEQQQTRNVREESARITRGNCKDLVELDSTNYDCLIIPGGFGAAKNLSDFGFKGQDMQVDDLVVKVLKDFHSQEKIIGLTCIAPILAAKVLGHKEIKMTLGKRAENYPYAGAIDVAASFGTLMVEMDVNQVCIDWSNNIVTTPAYMQADA